MCKLVTALMAVGGMGVFGSIVKAAPLTYEFTARVTDVGLDTDGNGFSVPLPYTVGELLHGTLRYDTSIPDSRPGNARPGDAFTGDYYMGYPNVLITETTGGYAGRLLESGLMRIVVGDDPPGGVDSFVVQGPAVFPTWDLGTSTPLILLVLHDNHGLVFDSDALPADLRLSQFSDAYLEFLDNEGAETFGLGATIESLRLVPEPSAQLLAMLALALFMRLPSRSFLIRPPLVAAVCAVSFAVFGSVAFSEEFTVTELGDRADVPTLRWAINQVNSTPNPQHRIRFAIPGTGERSILVTGTGLPPITRSVTIDGTSQLGYSGVPLIAVRGSAASLGANGFVFQDSTAQVSNLKAIKVEAFSANGPVGGHGVVINPSQSTELVNIEGCLIENNGGHGVHMLSGSNHRISRVSVASLGTFKSMIRNNAGYGVRIESGILEPVVELSDVTGNRSGGVWALANQARISSNRIFQNSGPGGAPVPGVRLGSASNLVEQNQIYANSGAGVLVESGKTNVQNSIRENETFANGGLGIDLGGNGPTCNDAAQDADGVQNYPKLNPLWQLSGGLVRVRGTLHSSPNHLFTVHFYVADAEGEGAAFLASRSVQTNASGNATFDFANLPATYSSNFLGQQLTLAPDDPLVATATLSGPRATSEFSNPAYGQGDTNQDGAITAADIDVLYDHFGASSDPRYDLDNNGTVNQADVDRLVRVILRTEYGDLDLDRDVDLTDFSTLKDHFGQPGGWASGDFNGNDTVDLSDFNLLKANLGFSGPCP